jgi:hypothetical protein
VHRLFYPTDKKGHKGIGLEIMEACDKAFGLAPGFWQGGPIGEVQAQEPKPTYTVKLSPTFTASAMELAGLFDEIPEGDRIGRAMAYSEASQAILKVINSRSAAKPSAARRNSSKMQPA